MNFAFLVGENVGRNFYLSFASYKRNVVALKIFYEIRFSVSISVSTLVLLTNNFYFNNNIWNTTRDGTVNLDSERCINWTIEIKTRLVIWLERDLNFTNFNFLSTFFARPLKIRTPNLTSNFSYFFKKRIQFKQAFNLLNNYFYMHNLHQFIVHHCKLTSFDSFLPNIYDSACMLASIGLNTVAFSWIYIYIAFSNTILKSITIYKKDKMMAIVGLVCLLGS